MAARSKASAYGRLLARISGLYPAGGHGCVCFVLYSKDKGTCQGDEDKQTNREKVKGPKKRKNSERKNSFGGEIFCKRPDQSWGQPGLLYNGYRVSCPRVKWPGRGVNHPPPSSAEVKEREELYLYYPAARSLPVLGRARALPLPFTYVCWLFSYGLAWTKTKDGHEKFHENEKSAWRLWELHYICNNFN